MRRVKLCNDAKHLLETCLPLVLKNDPERTELGLVTQQAAAELERFPHVFGVGDRSVWVPGDWSVEERSTAVAGVLQQLRGEGRVPMLRGWRNEAWPVKAAFDAPVQFVIERAAGSLLGVRGYGCHVNGLVKGNDGGLSLWVARRAKTKPTYPGKLDHMVAGGLAHGEQPREAVIRECAEEASVPGVLAGAARPVGTVSYLQMDETRWGVKRDLIFCYDLELPPDFVPSASDGEVESFQLWRLEDVIASLVDQNDDWKPNVALVIIDLLVRRGFVAPEDAGYVDLVRALRQ